LFHSWPTLRSRLPSPPDAASRTSAQLPTKGGEHVAKGMGMKKEKKKPKKKK